jgi:hypothetical protein
MLSSPEGAAAAFPYLATMLGLNVGHAGSFDYQRRGNKVTGYTQLRQFARAGFQATRKRMSRTASILSSCSSSRRATRSGKAGRSTRLLHLEISVASVT